MKIIARSSFPKSSVPQAAKVFTQLPKIPASVKREGPFFHFDEKDNVHTMSIYSFSDSQVTHENTKFVTSRLKVFSEVPGFSSSVESWLNMEEALIVVRQN